MDSEEVVTYPPHTRAANQEGRHKSLRMNVASGNSLPTRQLSVQLQLARDPISIENDMMIILPELMKTDQLYPFNYLDEDLLVKKTHDGKIVIYEVVKNGSRD